MSDLSDNWQVQVLWLVEFQEDGSLLYKNYPFYERSGIARAFIHYQISAIVKHRIIPRTRTDPPQRQKTKEQGLMWWVAEADRKQTYGCHSARQAHCLYRLPC